MCAASVQDGSSPRQESNTTKFPWIRCGNLLPPLPPPALGPLGSDFVCHNLDLAAKKSYRRRKGKPCVMTAHVGNRPSRCTGPPTVRLQSSLNFWEATMGLFITPQEFMNEYYHLDVRLDDGSVEIVKVDHYRNNDHNLPLLKDHHKTLLAKEKGLYPLLSKINAAVKKDASAGMIDGSPIDKTAISLTFVGKGMPDDIRQLCAWRSARPYPEGEAAKVLNNTSGSTATGLSATTCSRGQKHFGTNRSEGGKKTDWIAVGEFNRCALRRKNANDILANDVLVWDHIHVAIIDNVYQTSTGVEFDVVESHPFNYTPAGPGQARRPA